MLTPPRSTAPLSASPPSPDDDDDDDALSTAAPRVTIDHDDGCERVHSLLPREYDDERPTRTRTLITLSLSQSVSLYICIASTYLPPFSHSLSLLLSDFE